MMHKLTYTNFEKVFNQNLSDFIISKIKECNFYYNDLTTQERDTVILLILKTLFDGEMKTTGSHRINDWINGWGENLNNFTKTSKFSDLIPKYFGKFPYVRWNNKFIKPVKNNFEYNMVRILQYWLFEKYFTEVNNVYEFGCGTGHNLFRVQEVNENARLYGLDWASTSQQNIMKINENLGMNFDSNKFDFFNIDKSFKLHKNSGIFTFAALEQVSENYIDFIQYLITQKPKICLHIEPMDEYLDSDNLLDYLSIKYFEKRNYLSGLKTYLLRLQKDGVIEIIQDQKSCIGSVFIDGYSIIAWSVL